MPLITSARTHPVVRGIKIGSNQPPQWQSVPSPTFTLGTASNFPPSGTYQSNGYVTDANGDTITLTWISGSITGVTWDGGKFVYSGAGSAGTTGSLVLRANDGTDIVDSSAFSIVIESNLAWSATPSVSFVEASVTPVNLGSYVTNYNASTDEFRVTPSYSLPLWLSLTAGPGTGSGNLTPNGTQVDANDIPASPGIKIDVRRSGGAWVSSSAFGVTVTAAAQQVASGNRVLLSDRYDGPDWSQASSYLAINWANAGGDYQDANNTSQGSAQYASATVTSGTAGQTKTFSIAALVEKLRVENTGIYIKTVSGGGNIQFASKENGTYQGPQLSVTIGGTTYTCPILSDFYIDPSASSQGIVDSFNNQLRSPILLKFDLSGLPSTGTVSAATLTLTQSGSGSASYPAVYHVFRLYPPVYYTAPELELGGVEYGIAQALVADDNLGGHSSVVAYDNFASLAQINNGNWRWVPRNSGTWANGASFGTFTDLSLPAAEVTVEPGVGWGTSGNSVAKLVRTVYPPAWHNTLDGTADNPLTPPNRPWCLEWADILNAPQEAYLRYAFEIDPDADYGLAQDTGINMVRMARLSSVLEDLSGGTTPEDIGPQQFSYAIGWGGKGFCPRMNPSTHGPIFRGMLYAYDFQDWTEGHGNPKITFEPNICFRAGKTYTIEQYVKLNTWNGQGNPLVPDYTGANWNADGIIRIWVNGVRVLNITNRKIRVHSKDRIFFLPWGDFFAIGPINPSGQPYHFKFGAMAVSTDKTAGGAAYIGPAREPLPAWASTSIVGTWMDIPNTRPDSVPQPPEVIAGAPAGWQTTETNAAARLDAWSGPAFRKNGSVFILGPTGGHGDYFLNWMTKFNLGVDSPSASVLYTGAKWDKMWPDSYFASDGRGPHPSHSYYSNIFCDQRDWLVVWGAQGRPTTQTPFSTLTPAPPSFEWYQAIGDTVGPAVAVFDYGAGTWLARNTIPDLNTPAAGTDQNFAVHPVTGDIYYGHTWFSNTHKWDQANNRHSVFTGSPALNGYAPVAIDPIRNRLLSLAKAYSGTNRAVMDCTTGTFTTISISGAGLSLLDAMGNDEQMVWIDHLEKFLVISRGSHFGGSTVRLIWIDPVTFVATEYVTTNAPADPANGVLTKCAYAPELRGLVLMNRYNQNVKYLRLW